MQVKREHLAGLELALDEMHDMLDGSCETRLNRLIEQAKTAPFVTGADVVAFVKGDDAHRVISWHPDKPAFAHPVGTELMTVAQHSRIMAGAKVDANLYRQWFNAVQDLNPKYLEVADYAAAARLGEK